MINILQQLGAIGETTAREQLLGAIDPDVSRDDDDAQRGQDTLVFDSDGMAHLYLATHYCAANFYSGEGFCELWATEMPPGEPDWLMWMFMIDENEIPVNFCPACGRHLDALITRAND